MKRGETGVLALTCKDLTLTMISSVIFALNQSNTETTSPILTKTYPTDVTAEQTATGVIFYIPLNQSETLKFSKKIFIEGQISFVDNTAIAKTVTAFFDINDTLYTTTISGNAATTGQANSIPMTVDSVIYLDAKYADIEASVSVAETAAANALSYKDAAQLYAADASNSKNLASGFAQGAATSETNAKTSEDNAKVSETNSKTSETITAQAMTDYLAMLGVDVATLVGGKIPMSQIPATATQEIYTVTSESELTSLAAQRGDLAELIETVDGEPTITKTWQLLGDGDPTISTNWIIWGTSYAVQAGNATTATNAENANTINNHRLVEIADTDWATAVKDADTYYLVY